MTTLCIRIHKHYYRRYQYRILTLKKREKELFYKESCQARSIRQAAVYSVTAAPGRWKDVRLKNQFGKKWSNIITSLVICMIRQTPCNMQGVFPWIYANYILVLLLTIDVYV